MKNVLVLTHPVTIGLALVGLATLVLVVAFTILVAITLVYLAAVSMFVLAAYGWAKDHVRRLQRSVIGADQTVPGRRITLPAFEAVYGTDLESWWHPEHCHIDIEGKVLINDVPEAEPRGDDAVPGGEMAFANETCPDTSLVAHAMPAAEQRTRPDDEPVVLPVPACLVEKANRSEHRHMALERAVQDCLAGKTVRKAAREYGVPESTLRGKVKAARAKAVPSARDA